MHHAERPGGPVAAAQKCATHSPLSVVVRGRGDVPPDVEKGEVGIV